MLSEEKQIVKKNLIDSFIVLLELSGIIHC